MPCKKTIGITGATGFIGSALSKYLSDKGYVVIPVKRDFRQSDIDSCDIIINLAGASINCRWTNHAKKTIGESRINTTKRVVAAINNSYTGKPTLLISASAIGIYPSSMSNCTNDEKSFDEYSSERGNNFLAQICADWEYEALKAGDKARVIITRFGVILSPTGGALPKMSVPFRFGVAARIGNGKQPFSWIAMEDLLKAFEFLIEREDLNGVFNFTSPNPINNSQLTKYLARYFKCPVRISIPSFVFKVAYGEAATLFTEGQKVLPKRLVENGFCYEYPFVETIVSDDRRSITG